MPNIALRQLIEAWTLVSVFLRECAGLLWIAHLDRGGDNVACTEDLSWSLRDDSILCQLCRLSSSGRNMFCLRAPRSKLMGLSGAALQEHGLNSPEVSLPPSITTDGMPSPMPGKCRPDESSNRG